MKIVNYRGNGNNASGLDMVSGSWLEWRYGIRPIIQTIEQLIDLANKQINAWSGKMLRKSGKVKNSGFKFRTGSSGPLVVSLEFHTVFTVTEKYVSKLYFTEDYPTDWQHQFNIAIDQWPGIAWELVPLSFIIDRYIRIGHWIQALGFYAERKRTVKGMITSRKLVIDGQAYIDSCKLANVRPLSWDTDPKCHIHLEELDRRVVGSPTVSIVPPWSPISHSLSQSLDEITLLWQRMPKLRR